MQLINAYTNEYRVTVHYKNEDYNYRAKLLHTDMNLQTWMLWTKRKVFMFTYNTTTKQLKEDLQHREKPLPEDFMKCLELAFHQ